MNIIVLRRADHWVDGHTVVVHDRRADHIRTVLRASVGDFVRVGLQDGMSGEGVIQSITPVGVTLNVQLTQPPPARHRFDLVLALPRPKMLRRILRTVAEFGVSHLHLINSARVEKSYWQSPLLAPAKLEEALLEGMQRSRDTVMPQVHQHRLFRPFVEDRLVDLCAGRACWIAEMAAPQPLQDTPQVPALVLIGPEGGFVPFELALAQAVIAKPVHLGLRSLSVDTAVTTVLAQGS